MHTALCIGFLDAFMTWQLTSPRKQSEGPSRSCNVWYDQASVVIHHHLYRILLSIISSDSVWEETRKDEYQVRITGANVGGRRPHASCWLLTQEGWPGKGEALRGFRVYPQQALRGRKSASLRLSSPMVLSYGKVPRGSVDDSRVWKCRPHRGG